MNMDNFSTLDISSNNNNKSTSIDYTSTSLEKILLILIAAIGLLGSTYIFTASSGTNQSPEIDNLATTIFPTEDKEEGVWKEKFKDYIKISGKKRVDEPLTFEFLGDRSQYRYVMEMGDDMRMIITSDRFPYSYKNPGKYLLELKKIDKGLISTVATYKLKIKK